MQIEHKQIALQNALSTERIQKIQASASREQAAAVAGMQDHICTLPPSFASVPLLAMHVLTSAMTYTTHLHALPD